MIYSYKKVVFPQNENQVLNTSYCRTLDKNSHEQLDFYLGKGEITDQKSKVHKYILLGTKFSLRILAKGSKWFCDGTFKVAPEGYKQIYIFMTKYENFTVPCLYLLLTSKKEILYNIAFNHIKSLCHTYNYAIETKSVMMDYELAARNAIKFVFEKIVPKDDYFHFVKCLWTRAKKEGLCKEMLLEDTCLLIAFF